MTKKHEREEPKPENVAVPSAAKSNDVDSTWDGSGSLDDHRQKAFAEVTQQGFGGLKPKA